MSTTPLRRAASLLATVATAGLLAAPTLAASISGAQSNAAPQDSDLWLRNANVVDAAAGTLRANVDILVSPESGTIRSIRPSGGASVELDSGQVSEIDLGGRYVTPGLIDAHVHIATFDQARRALHSGVTTARSMGVDHFADVGLRDLAARGAIEAPEILAAGYHVRPRPADAFFMDFPELADLLESGVHGPDALRRMGEALAARGVDFIKTNATERAGLPETDPRKPFYDEAELHALVETGSTAGLGVAAHAHGDVGGRAAVLAGVRSIEHGTYLSPETLTLMAERGTYLVPTIAVVFDLTQPGGDYDNAALQVRGRHMLPRIRQTAAAAYRAGVSIVAATDTGYGPQSTVRLSHELLELVGVGMSRPKRSGRRRT